MRWYSAASTPMMTMTGMAASPAITPMGGASSGETVKPHTMRAINAAIITSTTTAAPTGLTYRVSLSCFPTFMNFVPSCSCRSMLASTPSVSSASSWLRLSRI